MIKNESQLRYFLDQFLRERTVSTEDFCEDALVAVDEGNDETGPRRFFYREGSTIDRPSLAIDCVYIWTAEKNEYLYLASLKATCSWAPRTIAGAVSVEGGKVKRYLDFVTLRSHFTGRAPLTDQFDGTKVARGYFTDLDEGAAQAASSWFSEGVLYS